MSEEKVLATYFGENDEIKLQWGVVTMTKEGKETIKALKVAIASVETNEAPGKDNNVTPKDETVGNINILRMIEELKKIGGDSLECKLNYCKDGVLYAIKISIEEVEHE